MIRYASCVWELPMPTTFRAYQPDQPLLLPPDLQEWVPPGHLAHHVSDVVDALDLTAFYAPDEGDGRRNAPYEPSMVDAEEDERWGEDLRGDELPEELQRREKRLAAIQAAKARLEAAQRGRDDERGREPGQDRNPRGGRPYKRAYGEPEPKAQSNFTDPESQIMKTSSEGFQQCYNAQMAVDGEHQIIVATQVGPQASDQGQLVGMLDEINETFGVEPAVVLADAGYCNEPDLLELEDRGIDAHVALGREGKSQVAVDPARLPATHRMGEKLASPAGKARYAQRKWLSEAPNGWIKEVLGFRRFSLRGLAKVRGEWDLVCLALNIKRMGTVATC